MNVSLVNRRKREKKAAMRAKKPAGLRRHADANLMLFALLATESPGLLVDSVVDTSGQIQPMTQLESDLGILQV